MESITKEISNLNWGTITPEFYNEERNSAVHIFNHYLLGEDNINRAINFVVGRINWYNEYLPKGCTHEVVFDDRGQNIDDYSRNRIINCLSNMTLYVRFMSKGR